jgi:tellurite resistance protein
MEIVERRCSVLREGGGVNNFSQLVALLRRVTLADGDVSTEERRWLRKLVSELPAETDVNEEFDEEKFKSLVTSEDDAEELLRAMLLLSLSDGQTSSEEWKLLQEAAELLSFSADRLERLRSETVLTAEPYS